MFCYKCGAQLPAGSVFCSACGASQQAAGQSSGSAASESPYAQSPYTVQQEPAVGSQDPMYGSQDPYKWSNEQGYPQPQSGSYPPADGMNQQSQQSQYDYNAYNAYGGYGNGKGKAKGGGAYGQNAYKKGGLWWKIAVPAAVVVIAAAAVYYFVFLSSPGGQVYKALSNVSAEVTRRIDGTPLKAAGLLGETMKDGTMTLNIDYADSYSSFSGSVDIAAKAEQREFALLGDVGIDGVTVDFEAYIDKERIAIGSRTINNNYYGITYETFADDIENVADVFGMDSTAVDQMTEYVDMIQQYLNEAPADSGLSEEYTAVITEFYENVEKSTGNESIESGGKTVNASTIELNITVEELFTLMYDLLDILENDPSYADMIETYGDMMSVSGGYGSPIDMMRDGISEMESSISAGSTFTVTLYLGSGDRLLRVQLDSDLTVYGSQEKLTVSADFGSSDTDPWEIIMSDGYNEMSLTWEYSLDGSESSGDHINTITVDDGYDVYTLESEWSAASGDFTLTYADDYDTYEITGTFTETGDGFALSLDEFPGLYDALLEIEIVVVSGADIAEVSFLNISDWDDQTVQELMEDIQYSGLGGLM